MGYNIGLKDFHKKYKGSRLPYKAKQLCNELKYAFQRAWRGYDDVDVFDFFDNFRERTLLCLKDLKIHSVGVWWVPESLENYDKLGHLDTCCNKRYFNDEETKMIIDTMIYHLKMSDESYVARHLHHNDFFENSCLGEKAYEKSITYYTIARQNKELFMKLFNLFYYDLWD